MGYKSNSYRRELKKAQKRRRKYLSKMIVLLLHNIIAIFFNSNCRIPKY